MSDATTGAGRDPNRIPAMVELLEGVWRQNPDWRLGQLISNACPKGVDLFYAEDDEWEDRLWRLLTTQEAARHDR